MSYIAELKNKNILIIGAGTTGKSVARYLENIGARFQIIDEKAATLDGAEILNNVPEDESFDLAIVSPGWRKDHSIIENLSAKGIEVISEIDFAWNLKMELNPEQKWVALTGTNGKTTTVQMLESILISAGANAIACGNVGTTVIEAVTSENKFAILAIELSSFQIDWSTLPIYEAVAILNLAEDHLDWHGSFSEYANAKMKLLNQSKLAVLNLNDPEVILRSAGWTGRKVFFGFDTPQSGEIGLVEELLVDRAFVTASDAAEEIAELNDIKPAVPHNVANAMAASGLALALGIAHPVVKKGIASFKLDKHRLQNVLSKDGIDWVNDSKATNPHAATAALLSHLSNIWIAGGLAKGAKMDELISRTNSRIKAAILIGKDAELIAKALTKHAPETPIHRIADNKNPADLMDEVINCAKNIASAGDTVLLAPACASMDQFSSYAQRGELFIDSVSRLVAR
ncbi:MAG: UDP-N-acetylmuramoyl-L-alanine--D-glutamate ligase [Actinobacteria bacterium]|nr:UDP-N-acetylmuramoyl-L-alanine--D-glutamate ligase [Actinomycetota bacterium]